MNGNIIRKNSHDIFWSLLSVLLLLCVTRYTLQINIPQVLLLGIACFCAVVSDKDELIALCICGIPLHTSFGFAYALLFSLLVFVVKFGNEIRLDLSIMPIIGIIICEISHYFGNDFAVGAFISEFLSYLLLAVMMCYRDSDIDYALVLRAYGISTVAISCSLIGQQLFLSDFDPLLTFANLQRLGSVSEAQSKELLVTGAAMNTNSLGVICVVGITGLVQLMFAGKMARIDKFLLALLLMFGIMTSSRTFLVCLLVMAVLLVFSLRNTLVKKLQFIFAAFSVLVVVVLLLSLFVPDLLMYYWGRFFEDDITTGRDVLMVAYHEYIMSNFPVLLWGIGMHDLGIKVTEVHEVIYQVPHNAIQEIVIAWGIPGLFLILAMIGSMFHRSRQMNRQQGLINYIPLIIILAKAQAGQMITSAYTMLALSLAYLSMCADLQPGSADRRLESPQLDTVDAFGIDFGRAVALLWRKKILIAAVAIIGAVGAYGITAVAVTPRYESKAMFFVNNARIELKNPKYGIYSSEIFVSRSLVDTYKVILGTRDTLNQVIEQTGVDLTYEELRPMIRASAVNETEIFEVKVTSEDPAQAELLANTIAEVLPGRIAGIVDGAAASVVDYAVKPASPSWPSKSTHAMLGFILGFVAVVTIILLRAMMDTTMRTEDDLMAAYPYPVLSAIPDLMERNRKKSNYYYNYSHYGYYQHDGKDEPTERG